MMVKSRAEKPVDFYVEHFTRAEVDDLDRALGQSLGGEISMLRMVIRRFFERVSNEADDLAQLSEALSILGLSCSRLAKVIQTEHNLNDARADELGEALSRSMAAVLEEIGQNGLGEPPQGGLHAG